MSIVDAPSEPIGRIRFTATLLLSGVAGSSSKTTDPKKFPAILAYNTFRLLKWNLIGISGSRVPLYPDRISLLKAAMRLAGQDGFWLEFGVFDGLTVNLIADGCTHTVFGFDSFEGLPDDWAPGYHKGMFSVDGKLPVVRTNVSLIKGWFRETLPNFVNTHGDFRASLIHVDSDLYSSASEILNGLAGSVREGTVIVFDEFVSLFRADEAQAFREFISKSGHRFNFVGCCPSGSVAVVLSS